VPEDCQRDRSPTIDNRVALNLSNVVTRSSPFSRLSADAIAPALIASLGLATVAIVTLLYRLGSIGLIDETEPLFAEAARQMAVTGDWVTPYYNDATRFDKPPLVYWLMAIGYRTFGVSEWTARLPSAIAAIGLMALVCVVTVRCVLPSRAPQGYLKPWLVGGLAGSIAVLNLHTLVWGRTGVSDMLLSGCMGGALLAFFMGYCSLQPSVAVGMRPTGAPTTPIAARAWFALFYVLLALAVLAKGPVGIVLPGFAIFLFLLLVGQFWNTVRAMGLWWGMPLFAAIVVPWFVLVIADNGRAYVDNFFGYHNVARFTGVVNRHSAPWYFYFLVVGFGFFPWSAYLPAAIAQFRPWQFEAWRRVPRPQQLAPFAFCWFLGIFAFFSIAGTKLPSYVLPLLPAGAILVAIVLADAAYDEAEDLPLRPGRMRSPSRWLAFGHGASVLLWLVWAIAVWTIPSWYRYDPAVPEVDRQLIASGICQSAGLGLAVVAVAIAVTIGLRRRWVGLAQVFGFCVMTIVSFHPFVTEIDRLRQQPLRELAETIAAIRQPDEPVVMLGFEKPSLVFYLRDGVTFLDRVSVGREFADCLPADTSALLIADESRQEDLELSANRIEQIEERQRYRLARIRPPARAARLAPEICAEYREP